MSDETPGKDKWGPLDTRFRPIAAVLSGTTHRHNEFGSRKAKSPTHDCILFAPSGAGGRWLVRYKVAYIATETKEFQTLDDALAAILAHIAKPLLDIHGKLDANEQKKLKEKP